jgi:hypothetical protein
MRGKQCTKTVQNIVKNRKPSKTYGFLEESATGTALTSSILCNKSSLFTLIPVIAHIRGILQVLQNVANHDAFAISSLLDVFRSSVFCEKTRTFPHNFAGPSWCSRALLCAGAVGYRLFFFESLPEVAFAAPACLNVDNLTLPFVRALCWTCASGPPGGPLRAVLVDNIGVFCMVSQKTSTPLV